MTLLRKFVLLLTLLALGIMASGFAAFWSFRFLRNELGSPFQSSVNVLSQLSTIKRNVEVQARIIASLVQPPELPGPSAADSATVDAQRQESAGAGFREVDTGLFPVTLLQSRRATPTEHETFAQRTASTISAIDLLEADTWYRSRVGGATWRNIKARVQEVTSLAVPLLTEVQPSDSSVIRRTLREYFEIHELIEKTEQRILIDAGDAVRHGDSVQRSLLTWLMSVLLVGALGSVLAFILLRRWVHRPVAALREAAAHIAQGNLRYRIEVHGGDELAQLSKEVNHMAEMVNVLQEERIDRERLAAIGGMVRRLVHNVRNPLAGIRGMAELTRMDMPVGTEHRDNLDMIVSTVDTFERWLNELLATTTPTNLQRRPTKVVPWMQCIVEVHRPMAQSKGVELVMEADDAPEEAVFDPTHLDHALAALVSNAIEATPEGGKVWVRAKRSTEPGKWEVHIIDQGGGIPPEIVSKVFEPHFTTKRRGTGMGLAMSQEVIRAHGGRIHHETASNPSKQQIGTIFVIRLPLLTATNEHGSLVKNSQ